MPAAAELRRGIARRAGIAAVQFVAPRDLPRLWWQRRRGRAGLVCRFPAQGRPLFSVFDNYSRPFDVTCFVLLAPCAALLAATRRLVFAPRILAALALVFAAYLLLPSQLLSGTAPIIACRSRCFCC